jgi:hypothetical protein
MKIKKLTNETMRVPLVQTTRLLKECQYDDDVSNIENAFNIPIPSDTNEPSVLFIISNAGIYAVDNMTLKEVTNLIRQNDFREIHVEEIPPALLEKLKIKHN